LGGKRQRQHEQQREGEQEFHEGVLEHAEG
jgi:hypothetical protein